ncbi:hypothetical protein H5P28_11660 [Ruficoccus amylovorans]|uniref:Uncharacterized protein n=1 Tax=Ruficoccus amylovorans TaxID=1804625 RepID=A0A842HH78_9BACT|nr:hypothetical protein [Ruficoccus amylovorans]MBC2594914.1 hypothetical protein [Ruficoccus amylovorans]
MKVIAIVEEGHNSTPNFIAEVGHTELEKFMDLFYGKMRAPKVGDIIDLGKGHDFHGDTCEALSKTEAFIESNKKVINGIMSGFSVLGHSAAKHLDYTAAKSARDKLLVELKKCIAHLEGQPDPEHITECLASAKAAVEECEGCQA